jgi:lysophospholipase L1-like esterase
VSGARIPFFLGVACSLIVFLVLMSLFGYRLYNRMRWYEEQFNNLILDPFQLNAYSPAEILARPAGSKRVVFFGDSRAAQWPAPQGAGDFEFINRGLDAQSAAQTAGRFAEHIQPLAPDFLVVQVGVNDLRVAALYPEREHEIFASCLEHIREVVHQAQHNGATIILTTIFPTGETTLARRWNGQADRLRKLVSAANAELALLAGEGVIVLDSAPVLADPGGKLKADYQLDELHLNLRGYEAMNTELTGILRLNTAVRVESEGNTGNE